MSILLAESGSTKTDWCYFRKGIEPINFKTSGINPHLQSEDDILKILSTELEWDRVHNAMDSICFYGAGMGTEQSRQLLDKVFRSYFGASPKIEIETDMMAAARSLSGFQNGIVCILGTGSNSCVFDGLKITDQRASLGFIAGDEGSGNHMGKKVLQAYAYHDFNQHLRAKFEHIAGGDLPEVLRRLYKEPFPNRYLAGFVKLLVSERGDLVVEQIIRESISDFFNRHLLKYPEVKQFPVHFTGSVSWEFRDVIANLCCEHEIELGQITKSPLDGLLKYHIQLLS